MPKATQNLPRQTINIGMTTILCLETATKNCSVAVAQNGNVVAQMQEHADKFIHAEKLHTFISQALKNAGVEINQLDAIAVSNGPGSYTGLRIGISAAKGLCYALNIPMIAINTTEVLAQKVSTKNGETRILAALDARRDEIYAQWFDASKMALSKVSAEIIDQNSFAEYLALPVVIVGDGAKKTAELAAFKNAEIRDELPAAADIAALAQQYFVAKQFVDVAYHEPFYLKDFVAGKPKKML